MKRIIFLMMVIYTLVYPLNFSAYGYSDVSGEKMTQAVELLQALNIMNGYEGDIFMPDRPVTRAEFAVIAARMMNANEKSDSSKLYYTDVPALHWALGAINQLTEMGILSGGGNGLFRPDDPVNAAEAYKMMLSITGYGAYAEAAGGFPSGYLVVANSTKIDLKVSGDKQLTRGEIALLAVNTLNISLLDITSLGSDGVGFDTEDEVTLLSRYRDIYVIDGQVTAVPGTSLTAETGFSKDQIAIDQVSYTYDGAAKALIGSTVKAYYMQQKGSDIKTIVYLNVVERITDEMTILASDILSFDEQTYTLNYQLPNKESQSKAVIAKGASVIYNGVAISTYNQDTFCIDKGRITLKRSSLAKDFDVVVIEHYENLIAGVVDIANKIVYDYYQPTKFVDLSGRTAVLKATNGLEMDLSSLKEKDVLTVLKGSNNYVEVFVSNETHTGEVTEIAQNDPVQFVIDGKTYDVDGDFLDVGSSIPSPGNTISYKVDVYGMIGYFATESKASFGYIYKGDFKDQLGQTMQLKMLTQTGAVTMFDCKNRIVLNGNARKLAGTLPDELKKTDGSFKPQVIRYKLDENGLIQALDTVVENSKQANALRVSVASTALSYRVIGLFGTKTIIDNNTIVFSVPTDDTVATADDSRFEVVKMNELAETTYDIETYKTQDKVGYEEVAVIKLSSERPEPGDGQYVLVDKITTEINSAGESVECLYGYLDGVMSVWYTRSDYSLIQNGIHTGDIIDPKLNGKSEIYDATLYYDCDLSGKPEWGNSTTDLHAVKRLMYGYPADKVDSILQVAYEAGNSFDEVYDITNAVILVYDANRSGVSKIYKGTAGDIALYTNVGSACSRILIQTSYAHSQIIFVYK